MRLAARLCPDSLAPQTLRCNRGRGPTSKENGGERRGKGEREVEEDRDKREGRVRVASSL